MQEEVIRLGEWVFWGKTNANICGMTSKRWLYPGLSIYDSFFKMKTNGS